MTTPTKNNVRFDANLARLLEEISCSPGLRPQVIAAKLGLNLSTVKSYMRKLRKVQLVSPTNGHHMVKLNPEYGYLIGIDMGASHLHFALGDFSGDVQNETIERVRPEDGPRKTIHQIKKGIQRLLPSGKRKRLRAVGMAVPSAVDPRSGLVLIANNLPGWMDIDLKHELEKEFHIPVQIENDANMAAIGEHWRGIARNAENFVFIALGTGIGSGIFINGQLYVGRTGAAGELQFLQVEWPRWNEDFGNTGYFESHASGQGIAALGRRLMSKKSRTSSKGLAEARDAYFVFEAFHKGEKRARRALDTIFTILGVGVANVVGILDPDMIVLGGGITRGAPDFMLSTVSTVAQRIQPNCPPILISAFGERAQTYGAIYSALMAACRTAAGGSK